MSNLDKNLRNYYSSKSLSEDKVQLLLGEQRSDNLFNRYSKYAVAVTLVLGLFLTFSLMRSNKLENRVAKEIAMNHNKQLNVEFASDNLNLLQSKLNKLDFSLMRSQDFIARNYKLMGGRYCSIQGNLAAQLKIQNIKTNKIETLYVSGLNGELKNIKPSKMNYDGANIKVWTEDGLLYGIASDSNN
ncbi:MAG: hypothetical protein GTO02_16085 [Candidatus Dadabacteria bacterium]|nr:hypothetical protein [Candidatus Dadabacteria bacterium]NIQ15851.1 hypothetical protein [Candidatus Dadabacteria bacterium]